MTFSPQGGNAPALNAMSNAWSAHTQLPAGSSVRTATFVASGAPVSSVARWILALCVLLMVLTFTPQSEANGGSAGFREKVAKVKTVVRALVLAGVTAIITRNLNSARAKHVFWFLLPWLGFGTWAVASTLWSPLKSISLGQSASFFILVLLACAVALTAGRSDFEFLIQGLVYGLVGLCVGLIIFRFAFPDWGSLSRGVKGLLHATNGSATASLGFVLLVGTRLLYDWRWTRSLLWPGLIIFSATLVLAQNRTALAISVFVCGGLVVLLAPPLWRAMGMAAFGILGLVYLAVDLEIHTTDFVLTELSTYLARGQTIQQMAQLSGREEMWTAIWNSFLQSPWIGHGYFVCNSSGELYVWYEWANWTAHNFWLQVLVSTGIVGAAWMAFAFGKLACGLFRSVLRGHCEWQLAALIATVMVWQIGWGVNNESFVGPVQPESVVYLVLVGLVAGRIAEASLLHECPAGRAKRHINFQMFTSPVRT